jgi:hypothetical protein
VGGPAPSPRGEGAGWGDPIRYIRNLVRAEETLSGVARGKLLCALADLGGWAVRIGAAAEGVDRLDELVYRLDTIPGVDLRTAQCLIAEEDADDGESVLALVKAMPGNVSLESMLREIRKLTASRRGRTTLPLPATAGRSPHAPRAAAGPRLARHLAA